MRYPHYLKQCSAGQWPGLVLSVECQTRPVCSVRADQEEGQQLDHWSSVALFRMGHNYENLTTLIGQTPEGFWSALSELTIKHSHTLILSSNCSLAWHQLLFWEKLEDETITLEPDPVSAGGDQDDSLHQLREEVPVPHQQPVSRKMLQLYHRRKGFLVLCDSVKIACFRFSREKGVIRWADTRNFGVSIGHKEEESVQLNRRAVSWFLSAHAAAEQFHLGAVGNTSASWAFKAFKRSYMEEMILVHNNKAALNLEEASYYGGRCEVFRLGRVESTIWHLDFRSLYPYVCTTTAVPVRLRVVEVGNPSQRLPDGVDPISTIARVSLHTEEPAYPVERNGVVIYPVGRFTTVLAGPELQDAYVNGRIAKWHDWATYAMAPALATYAQSLYDLRCYAEDNGNEDLANMVKRMLVCLPGKFGGKEYSWIRVPNAPAPAPYSYWWGKDAHGNPVRFRSIAWNVEREVIRGWHPEACPAIAAWITSAGRMRLLEALRCVGREHVVYCDTDSVMVDERGLHELGYEGIHKPRALGYLDLKSVNSDVEILGIKHYRESDRLVCSGLPHGSPERGKDACKCPTEVSPMEFVRKGRRPEYIELRNNHGRFVTYQHGNVDDNGKVTPIQLNEWQ